MKRKSLFKGSIRLILALLLAGSLLLAGCAGSAGRADSNAGDNTGSTADNTGNAADNQEIVTDNPEDVADKPADYDFAGAFAEKQVYNNGSYFVRIGDKVFFRNISPESMEEGAIFGEFLRSEYHPAPCPLICYDLNTCQWEEAGEITGAGKLFACPGGFYIGEPDSESPENNCTYLYDPAAGESGFYCKGTPVGISSSGQLLAAEQYGGQGFSTVLMKGGKEIASLGGENQYYEYIGFAEETLILMRHTANEEYILCSVSEDGEVAELGMAGNAENGFAEPKQFMFVNGEIYVCLGYYEGTGHFLSKWDVVKAVPGAEGSLETALNGYDAYEANDSEEEDSEDGEGPDPDVPIIFFDETGTLRYSKHAPSTVYMGEGSKENDLFYCNDASEECLLIRDFIDRSSYEKCSFIQDLESVGETAFVIYADAEADSEYDIGWRMGYRMTGWHICAVPFDAGHLDPEGLAKDIIQF